MAYRSNDRRHRDMHEDVKPPNSRLFILCGKGIKEEAFKEAFEKFGTVEDIWIVKDRKTNEEKGNSSFVFKSNPQPVNVDVQNNYHMSPCEISMFNYVACLHNYLAF